MLLEREEPAYRTSSRRHLGYLVAALAVAGVVLLIATAPPTVIVGPIVHFNRWGDWRTPVPAKPPKGWIMVDVGHAFSLYAPRGTAYRPLQGIDSFVGEIAGPHFKMQFDFGLYSADTRETAKDKDFHFDLIEIDGRQAEITTSTGTKMEQNLGVPYEHLVALYMASAACNKATSGYGLSCEPNKLGIYGAAQSPEDAETVKKIYKTLRFPD